MYVPIAYLQRIAKLIVEVWKSTAETQYAAVEKKSLLFWADKDSFHIKCVNIVYVTK